MMLKKAATSRQPLPEWQARRSIWHPIELTGGPTKAQLVKWTRFGCHSEFWFHPSVSCPRIDWLTDCRLTWAEEQWQCLRDRLAFIDPFHRWFIIIQSPLRMNQCHFSPSPMNRFSSSPRSYLGYRSGPGDNGNCRERSDSLADPTWVRRRRASSHPSTNYELNIDSMRSESQFLKTQQPASQQCVKLTMSVWYK